MSLRRMAYEILAMRDDFLFRDVQEEFDFCLNRDAETGMIAARWGGREDDKPDAADVQWLRGQLGRLRALAGEVAAGGATCPSSGGQDERRRSR